MKTKKFNKKLELNKQTVADLRNDEMKNAKGGAFTDDFTCNTCFTAPEMTCNTYSHCTHTALQWCTQSDCRTFDC